MSGTIKYLFDSDVLISSARLHYSATYCQAFWDWMIHGYHAGLFFSIDKVRDEFLSGSPDDQLNEWACSEPLQGFFQSSQNSLIHWRTLSTFATDPQKNYTDGAKAKFLDSDRADAWLITHAAHCGGFKIVTNEVSRPNSRSEIKLPDAAKWLGVETVKIFDIFRMHAGHNFTLKVD